MVKGEGKPIELHQEIFRKEVKILDGEIKQSLIEFILRIASGKAISDKEVEILPEIVKIVIGDFSPL